jgi:hypothetical protein
MRSWTSPKYPDLNQKCSDPNSATSTVENRNLKNAKVAKPMVTLRIGQSLQSADNSEKVFKQTALVGMYLQKNHKNNNGGSGMFSQILDLNFFHPGSRIRIKEFKYFNPKNGFSALREI